MLSRSDVPPADTPLYRNIFRQILQCAGPGSALSVRTRARRRDTDGGQRN
jgi:hypothetical protein